MKDYEKLRDEMIRDKVKETIRKRISGFEMNYYAHSLKGQPNISRENR